MGEHSDSMPSEEAIRDLIGRFWDCNIDRAEALEAWEDGDADAFLKKRYEWCIAAKDERKGMADECMEEWKEQAKEEEAFLKERYEWCVAAKDERKGMADEAMEEWKEQQ